MKQINIRVDDDLAKRVYVKIAKKRVTLQSLIQRLLETWLNEDDASTDTQKDNSQDLPQKLLNQEIIARLDLLEKNVFLVNSNNNRANNSDFNEDLEKLIFHLEDLENV